jgi:U4/U6 small nuclear ribonucleoprotein PRP3
MFLFLTLPIF